MSSSGQTNDEIGATVIAGGEPGAPSGAAHERRSQAWKTLVTGAGLALLVLVAYWPAFDGGFVSDDGTYVVENRALRTPQGLFDLWFKLGTVEQYYPLVHTSFWLEYQLWEAKPRSYHAVNVILHIVAVLLAWRLLLRLKVPGAILGAALFAVHPVEVESVAWISERKNVLSMVFALGSLLAYFRFAPCDADDEGERQVKTRRWGSYALALVLFAAAILSKSVTASVPAVILVVAWWKHGRIAWRDVVPLLPMFVIGLAMAALTVWMEQTYVGARGEEFAFSPAERFLIAGRALCFYVAKLIWPHPLIFYLRWTIDDTIWWQYLYPLGVAMGIVVLWLERKTLGRGPLAATLIFAGVLTPALGFFNVYPFKLSFVADHYQYHASLALLALFAAGLTLWSAWPTGRWLTWPLTAVVLVSLGTKTWQRTHVYRDSFTLELDTATANPQAFASHVNLGAMAAQAERLDEAVEHFSHAVIVNPSNLRARNNLSSLLRAVGRSAEAERLCVDSLTLVGDDSDKAAAHILMQMIRIDQQRYDEAIEHCRAALTSRPNDAVALYNWAKALHAQGKIEEAEEKSRQSVEYDPSSSTSQYQLGALLAMQGKYEEAIEPMARAVMISPSTFYLREELAAMFISTGKFARAESELNVATRLNRKSARAHFLLGIAILEQGRRVEALPEFREALALDPNHKEAAEYLKNFQSPPPAR